MLSDKLGKKAVRSVSNKHAKHSLLSNVRMETFTSLTLMGSVVAMAVGLGMQNMKGYQSLEELKELRHTLKYDEIDPRLEEDLERELEEELSKIGITPERKEELDKEILHLSHKIYKIERNNAIETLDRAADVDELQNLRMMMADRIEHLDKRLELANMNIETVSSSIKSLKDMQKTVGSEIDKRLHWKLVNEIKEENDLSTADSEALEENQKILDQLDQSIEQNKKFEQMTKTEKDKLLTVFWDACWDGDLKSVKRSAERLGVGIHSNNDKGFENATYKGRVQCAKFLVEFAEKMGSPINIYQKQANVLSGIAYQGQMGHRALAKYLINLDRRSNAPVNYKKLCYDQYGQSPYQVGRFAALKQSLIRDQSEGREEKLSPLFVREMLKEIPKEKLVDRNAMDVLNAEIRVQVGVDEYRDYQKIYKTEMQSVVKAKEEQYKDPMVAQTQMVLQQDNMYSVTTTLFDLNGEVKNTFQSEVIAPAGMSQEEVEEQYKNENVQAANEFCTANDYSFKANIKGDIEATQFVEVLKAVGVGNSEDEKFAVTNSEIEEMVEDYYAVAGEEEEFLDVMIDTVVDVRAIDDTYMARVAEEEELDISMEDIDLDEGEDEAEGVSV